MRAVEICGHYNLPFINFECPIDELPDLDKVEHILKENQDIALVYTTHNETGTGILNPVREIGLPVHRYGTVFIVDTISTYAMKPIDIEKDNIDFCMASAQKGLMAMAELSFVIGNIEMISKSTAYPKRSYYRNLYMQYHLSYHGISYTETYGKKAYIVKARMQLMRDFGVYPAAHSAFLLNLGLETLAVRMKQYCENAMTVAKYLEQSDKVERVNYPGLESDENYELAQKYLSGCSGIISFVIKGGKEAATKFMNELQLASNKVHVSDIRTCVLHPASETHRQLTDEQLVAAGIEQGLVRLSVGLESVEDIIDDLEQAFSGL